MSLLKVQDLQIWFGGQDSAKAVDGVTFALEGGEKVGLIGESGSGKTLSCLAIQGLQPASAKLSGSIEFHGQQLLGAAEQTMRQLRGDQIAAIFQEPMTALNPVLPIWRQLVTANLQHDKISPKQAKARATELAGLVGLPEPKSVIERYPHELSGGQRQRVVIAMAISAEPRLVLADEPTTALDATVAARILELLAKLCDELGSALLLVTHDMALAATTCDRLLVMQHGKIVESSPTRQLMEQPQSQYSKALIKAARATSLDIPGARAALLAQRSADQAVAECSVAPSDSCQDGEAGQR